MAFSHVYIEILDTVFSWWHQYGKDNFVFWIGTYSNVLVTSSKYLEVSYSEFPPIM